MSAPGRSYSVAIRCDIYDAQRGGGLNVERRFEVKELDLNEISRILGALDELFKGVEQKFRP